MWNSLECDYGSSKSDGKPHIKIHHWHGDTVFMSWHFDLELALSILTNVIHQGLATKGLSIRTVVSSSKANPGLQELIWWVVFRHPSEKHDFVNWDDNRNPILMGKCQIDGNQTTNQLSKFLWVQDGPWGNSRMSFVVVGWSPSWAYVHQLAS